MPDSFFYETNRTAFSICATCQRSCGLSASPRATTCAVGAGRAFKPSALRRRAEPHRRAVRKRGKPLLSVFRSYPPYIENRAVGLSLPVRHFVMKLPDYGRGRICRAANRLHAGTLPHPARQHRRHADFWLYAFIGFKDPRSCLRVPSLGILYRDSTPAPSDEADAENRIPNAGIRRIGFLSHSLSFLFRDTFVGLSRQKAIGHNDTYTCNHKNSAVPATDDSSF